MDFKSAVEYLEQFSHYENIGFPKYDEAHFNLERVKNFLKNYGVDYQKLKFIHVGGSKGKGSVCHIIANYLCKMHFNVGMFSTPYIIDITECFWLNGRNISKEKFVKYVEDLKKFIKKNGNDLTYFELLTVLILKYFVESRVDFAILEVGLGGRLDATNVVMPVAAVLTTIEKEHTDILGKTLKKILNEKLGIIKEKPKVPFLVGYQSRYVDNLIRQETRNIEKVVFVDRKEMIDFHGLPKIQVKNANVALNVLELILGKVDMRVMAEVLLYLKIPARFEIKEINGRTVVLDIAHTKNSAIALTDSLKQFFPNKKFVFLISIMKGKDVIGILRPVMKIAKKIVMTSSHKIRGHSAFKLKKIAEKVDFSVHAQEDCVKAYEDLFKTLKRGDVLVVTGSHFLISRLLSR